MHTQWYLFKARLEEIFESKNIPDPLYVIDIKLKPHLDREKDEKEAEEAKAKEKAAEAEAPRNARREQWKVFLLELFIATKLFDTLID